MMFSIWSCVAFFPNFRHAFALPASSTYFGSMELLKDITSRDDPIDEFVPDDLSHITKLAAIGDSYSAGIGAGDKFGSISQALDPQSDWACARYDHSYPYLVSQDPRFGDPKCRRFQFLSCSGAVTDDVLLYQLPAMNGGQQAIMISIGGNDLELENILNQCIYQWASLTWDQAILARIMSLTKTYKYLEGYDWPKLGRTCEQQLDITGKMLIAPKGQPYSHFYLKVSRVIKSAQLKLADGGRIYLTGYAKFFAESMTPECDKVTWSTYVFKVYNIWQPLQRLTQAHRRKMNDLVDQVNQQLKSIADDLNKADPKSNEISFVDWDEQGLMFYEFKTFDPWGSSPRKRSNDDPANGTFEGDVNVQALLTNLLEPDAKLADGTDLDVKSKLKTVNNSTLKGLKNMTFVNHARLPEIPKLLPDGYGRVFHHQVLAHELIANLILFEMTADNQKRHNQPDLSRNVTIDTCSYNAPGSTDSTPSCKGKDCNSDAPPKSGNPIGFRPGSGWKTGFCQRNSHLPTCSYSRWPPRKDKSGFNQTGDSVVGGPDISNSTS